MEWYAARALVIYKGKILLLFRRRVIDISVKEYYVTLGGSCEEWESFEDALVRELREEAWLKNITIRDIISDYTSDDISRSDGIAKKTSRIYLVESHDEHYIQTAQWEGPESKRNSNSNSYEIRECHRKDLYLLPIKPDNLKNILIEYALKNGYLS